MDSMIKELQLAGFMLGDRLFAVDIMRIKEIIIPHRLSSFPMQHETMEGMINLRGQVIPVINLRACFGMPPAPEGAGKLIVTAVAGRLAALAVDDLDEVITVAVEELIPPPDLVEGVGGEYLIAVCLANDRLYLLLDIDALFITGL